MTERAFNNDAGSSSGPFNDPFHMTDGLDSPDTNAWESFLTGKEGSTPLMKETTTSYLDHFEAVSNEANLLLGGLRLDKWSEVFRRIHSKSIIFSHLIEQYLFNSPERPSLPDRHVRGSSSSRNGSGRNPRSNSASPPKMSSASPSISSPRPFSSSPSTYGAPSEETLEEKIARVMSGNYSSANPAIVSTNDASSDLGSRGRVGERGRERERKTESVSIYLSSELKKNLVLT